MKIILRHNNAIINWDNILNIIPKSPDSDLKIYLKDGYTTTFQCDNPHKVLKEITNTIEYEISKESYKNVIIVDLEKVVQGVK
jgi:hypothetical protein